MPKSSIPATYQDLYAYYGVWPGDLIVEDDFAINESIRNILSVPTKSLIFNRQFGSDLIKLLHEPMNEQTAQQIRMYSIIAVDRYEPRVETVPFLCFVKAFFDTNVYELQLGYRIRRSNIVNSFSFKLQGAK